MTKILVVDDDPVDREMARRCLEELDGLEVVFCNDGREAIEAMPGVEPDVVLTDLRMPGVNGLELVERLVAEWPIVPVILMTSQGNERIAVQALQAGAASYVPKSDLANALAETVEQVLAVADARRGRAEILGFLDRLETRFELENDPRLISSLVVYIEDNLARLGFGDETSRSQIGMALMEALSNAMLHGNLEVDSDLRRDDRDAFQRQIEERRRSEPYATRRVTCRANESPTRVEYTIADEGPGFDVDGLPDPTDPANLLKVGGRGIMLMKTVMDEVAFARNGSHVTLVKRAS